VRVPSLVCKWYDTSPTLMNITTKVVHFGIVTIWWAPTIFFEQIFTLLWEFGIMVLSIQWFLDENHQIKKKSWKKSRFFYMVQVGNQKFTRIFQFLLHILLISKLGYKSLWMIATSTASQNWKKNIEELDMKKGMKYIIKVHKIPIEKEKVRDLFHMFWT